MSEKKLSEIEVTCRFAAINNHAELVKHLSKKDQSMPMSEIFQKYYNNEITEEKAINLMDSNEAKETLMDLWNSRIIPPRYFEIFD